MATSGSCHCGAVRITVPVPPSWVASCNCSICRRTGSLMAYYSPAAVRVEGETAAYLTGDRFIRLHHCPACGCQTHWSANPEALAGNLPEEVRGVLAERMGINARLLDGFASGAGDEGRAVFTIDGAELEVRLFDNA